MWAAGTTMFTRGVEELSIAVVAVTHLRAYAPHDLERRMQ